MSIIQESVRKESKDHGNNLLHSRSRQTGGRKTPLVAVCASDASKNTKSRIENSCNYYEVPLVKAPITCEELGNIVGKGTAVSVVGITDMNLADAILKYFN